MFMELLILLNQKHTICLLICGDINQEIMAIVWWTKHGGCCKGFINIIKRLLGSLILVKRVVLFQQMNEAFSQVGKINHEPLQEVCHAL